MKTDASFILNTLDIKNPPIAVYDSSPDAEFTPISKPKHCIYECINDWFDGKYTIINKYSFTCPGAAYWMLGISVMPREKLVEFLYKQEGLKASKELLNNYLDNNKPYIPKNDRVVVGPINEKYYDDITSITIFVNPDQLSALITAANYNTAEKTVVTAPFGSGCSLLLAPFSDPKARNTIIGCTDAAMRKYIPKDMLCITMNKPVFEDICNITKESFLTKAFVKDLKEVRGGGL
jgi:hypothetical protein